MYGMGLEGSGVSEKAKDTPRPAGSHQEVGRNTEEKKGGNTVRACERGSALLKIPSLLRGRIWLNTDEVYEI